MFTRFYYTTVVRSDRISRLRKFFDLEIFPILIILILCTRLDSYTLL